MANFRLLNTALALLCAVILCACGGNDQVQPTPLIPAATATPLKLGESQALPPLTIPGMGADATKPILGKGLPDTVIASVATTLGPPDWVKVGTRITYYNAAALVAESRFVWIEDPNGEYTDPKTGKHYRRSDEGDNAQEMATGSGDGYTQVDVLAIEGTDVVLTVNLYGIDRTIQTDTNRFVPAGSSGGRVKGAVVDGLWINPIQLAELETAQMDNVLILKGDYQLDDKTYPSITFASTSQNAYQSYTYDLETGLLLSATTSTPSAGQGTTQLTSSHFVGTRQRNVSGITGTNPPWVANTTKLQYNGTYNVVNPLDPTSLDFTYPTTSTIKLSKGGKTWAPYTSEFTVGMTGQPSKGSNATGTTGLYWYDTTALKTMKAKQKLDEDPVTGAVTTVRSIGTQNGSKIVTIDTDLNGMTATTVYDQASGVLLSYILHVDASGTTITLKISKKP